MTVIPCEQDPRLRAEIDRFAEVLKTQAHTLGEHGLNEADFYQSPIFRGAIEKLRGEYSATMRGKREFVQHVLNHMEDGGHIAGWDPTPGKARNDYYVRLNSGRLAVIDLKGCLDGENTNKFERPVDADEFITWSLCTNTGADPRRNAWSGIHTRLSAEMISRNKRVDGVVIWDMICGTLGRPCPKLATLGDAVRRTAIGPFLTPPPCIYVFPATMPIRLTPTDTSDSVLVMGQDAPKQTEGFMIGLGEKVKWISPMGLIWLGVVTEVQGDQVRVHWDGKWGSGPLMAAAALTPYEG